MTITFTGLSSVADRTLFTNRGPIVKKPLPLLTGSNLRVASETDVVIPTGTFNSSNIGHRLDISGSAGSRNDGSFYVKEVISPTRLRLENVSFDVTDVGLTTSLVIGLANELKIRFNGHRTQSIGTAGVHGTNDTTHIVTAATAVDLATSITLLNDIRAQFILHIADVSGLPPVHKTVDVDDQIFAPAATSLASAIILANELRRHFEVHRQNRKVHQNADSVNRVILPVLKPVSNVFPGPLTGPFNWVLNDPRTGIVADDPSDVSVLVNSAPAGVDAVFGLLGAVVLSSKPGPTDTVTVDYAFLNNPPARLLRLNSSEFNLNQAGNLGYSGLPSHRYRSRSYLIDPSHSPDFMSAVQPLQVGWKYKALERAYSAVLNDPNSLLLNVPSNKLSYPVLFQKFVEVTVRYDPTSLPQNAADPWKLEGDGSFALAPGGNELTITDFDLQTGPLSKPPFFTHEIDLRAPSIMSAAFRVYVQESTNDGVFTGVSFGISDGQKVAVVGFILTDATNLSSAITMVNDAKAKFNSHLVELGVHDPNDPSDSVAFVDATNLTSLIILANEVKAKINFHMAKGAGAGVHVIADGANVIVSPDADSLETAITLINEIRSKFNLHRVQPGVHFTDDGVNVINQVRQAGFLTNRGFSEFQESWNSASVDWMVLKTYRIFRDSDGDVSLFLSGGSIPIATAFITELPSISDLDGRFDPLQQVFFGPIGRESTSISKWSFVRINTNPIDSNLVGDNKKVDYDANTTPELDSQAPWITVGQGGVERINSGLLILDSTASAPSFNIEALGLSSGAYRGFLRLEPILSVNTACSFEFRGSIDFWTQSLDNRAAAVVIDDDNFSVQLCFLQFTPSPAVVTGSSSQPFPLVNNDQFIFSLSGNAPVTVAFTGAETTAADVVSVINTAVGFALGTDVAGKVRLTSQNVGINATIQIIAGSALSKLGFSPGVYAGRDSNPEPRVSWFGENLPDLDNPIWTRAGNQKSEMLGRTMRLTDSSSSDYVVFSLADPVVTNQAFNSDIDWKLDCRLAMMSFTAGDVVPAIPPYLSLNFCGALVSVDEGPDGKSLELQLSADPGTGSQYLNLLSYNSATGALDVKAQYAFSWGDKEAHSFDVYTSKAADSIFVLADGVLLSPLGGQSMPTYSGLNTGLAGPSLAFGSGSAAVTNSDVPAATSVVDWSSVTVFRDSKISDPMANTRRFIGIYAGGDPAVLTSYYLFQVDWTSPHVYRIVRDPVSSVSVFLDGGYIPVISTSFDSLRLPPVNSSFLKDITSGHQAIAFGSFNPQEIVRTRWDYIKYSIGKLTLTDRLVPHGHVLNRANAVSSPDHLFTTKSHQHLGFTIYSGGTPIDEFMSDEDVDPFTVLGEGTPPIPMTENLESRGGLLHIATPVEDIPSVDLVNTKGFLADIEDDDSNLVTAPDSLSLTATIQQAANVLNNIQSIYNLHRTSPGVHPVDDTFNPSAVPAATDLASAIMLANDLKFQFNKHRVQPGVHDPDDSNNVITAPDAGNDTSLIVLTNDITNNFFQHARQEAIHSTADAGNVVSLPNATDLTSLAILADQLREKTIAHAGTGTFHGGFSDFLDSVITERVVGLSEATVQADLVTVEGNFLPLAPGNVVRFLTGPNSGSDRTVNAVDFSTRSFTVTVPWGSASPGVMARVESGQPVLDLPSTIALLNDIQFKYNRHLTLIQGQVQYHKTQDIRYTSFAPSAYDLTTAMALANDLKAEFNGHRTGHIFHLTFTSLSLQPQVQNPLDGALALASDVLANYNRHVVRPRSHVTADEADGVFLPDPIDVPSLIAVANKLKERFNIHRTKERVHSSDDVVNVVTSPDATSLDSAVVLLNEIKLRYNAHTSQNGVHGASMFIRLDPPSRVLYEGMKFYKISTGEAGHVSPFSDDETWHLDSFNAQQDQTLTYTGAALPENAQLVGGRLPPFAIVGGETLMLKVDDGALVAVTFQAGDVNTAAIAARINGTVGLPPTLASVDSGGGLRLISPTAGLPSKIEVVGGTAVVILGLDVPQYTPWFIVSDDPDAVSVSLMSAGPVDFMRYGTTGSTRTAYENRSGIPDVTSAQFQMTVSIRVNAVYSPSTNIDTGIYVGLSGIAGPGFTVGIGFEKLGSFRYVKIQDLNSGRTLYRRPFDWSDGAFHTYRLVRDVSRNSLQFAILN